MGKALLLWNAAVLGSSTFGNSGELSCFSARGLLRISVLSAFRSDYFYGNIYRNSLVQACVYGVDTHFFDRLR